MPQGRENWQIGFLDSQCWLFNLSCLFVQPMKLHRVPMLCKILWWGELLYKVKSMEAQTLGRVQCNPVYFMVSKWRPRDWLSGLASQSLSFSGLRLELSPPGPLATYATVEVKIQLPQQNWKKVSGPFHAKPPGFVLKTFPSFLFASTLHLKCPHLVSLTWIKALWDSRHYRLPQNSCQQVLPCIYLNPSCCKVNSLPIGLLPCTGSNGKALSWHSVLVHVLLALKLTN